ncbi:hypothetical protein [Micromonospora sp. WMMD708]|uniref:hypothetical protein n=1 Tax=Micromonospora sp. WMMD708 TaxID=3403464 RepID=UPI003BF472D7
MHLVTEAGGVLDPVQVRRRRTRDDRAGGHPEEGGATGQGVVAGEAGIGVHVVTEPEPGRPAQLVAGE